MHQYTEKEKLEWLADWKTSKISAKSFAEDKPFNVSSLRYWERKFKSTSEPTFIQVVPERSSISPYARLTYPTGETLDIFTPVPSDYIKGLLT